MKKNVWKKALIFMTIIAFLLIGLKFDGNLSHLLEQRADFMNNVQMGGSSYSLSLASLKYYVSYITEPFAFRNIFGNAGLFAGLSFCACGAFSDKKLLSSWAYSFSIGVGIELFQYFTCFGAFDLSDILLRFAGIMAGILMYIAVSKLFHEKDACRTK